MVVVPSEGPKHIQTPTKATKRASLLAALEERFEECPVASVGLVPSEFLSFAGDISPTFYELIRKI